jgi:broad specificity phosphatase PhoE
MRRRELLFGGLIFPWIARSDDGAPPKQVYLIRHGEKSGDKSDIHLNARGRERAAALVTLFRERLETPQALFASRRSAHSDREMETLMPLAAALHLKIDNRYADEEYPALAKDVLAHYGGKTVLVCWHHGNLPALAGALGVKNAPSPWPEQQFDRVWRVRFEGGVTLEDLPEHVLDRDS